MFNSLGAWGWYKKDHDKSGIISNISLILNTNEPRREKTGFLHIRKQRRRSASRLQLRGNHEADQRLYFFAT